MALQFECFSERMNGGVWKKLIINIDYLILSCFFVTEQRAFSYACLANKMDIFDTYLDKMISSTGKNEREWIGFTGLNALFYPSDYTFFVNEPHDDICHQEFNPLTAACHMGHFDIVHKLLVAGAIVQPISDDDFSPLVSTMTGRQPSSKIFNLLILYGADVNKYNNSFNHEIYHAVCKMMMFNETYSLDIRSEITKIFESFVALCTNINYQIHHRYHPTYFSSEHNGYRFLTLAAGFKLDYFVKLLLERGADPNFVIDEDGCSIFFAAQELKTLLEGGADPNIANIDGDDGFCAQTCSGKCSVEDYKLLLTKVNDVNKLYFFSGKHFFSGKRVSALGITCATNNLTYARALLEHGANVLSDINFESLSSEIVELLNSYSINSN
jgi:ankyrin repeat protein